MKKWIQKAIKNKGALHRTLGIPEDKKIPMARLIEASKSSNPRTRKRAILAMTLRKFHK